MREEIQRLKKMGMKKKAVARTLDISRNTLKKYWDETLAEREPEGPGVPVISVYHAPWSEQVDWDDVRKACHIQKFRVEKRRMGIYRPPDLLDRIFNQRVPSLSRIL